MALVKIAVRNLVQHRGKTLIIGVLVALGVTILVAGSSVLQSASASLQRSFTDRYTGQVVITGKARGSVGLFGVAETGSAESIPVLPDHEKIRAYLSGNPEVKGITPQVSGAEQLNRVGEDVAGGGPFVYLFGIDAATRGSVFPDLNLVSGAPLSPGQEGILLSTSQVREFAAELGQDLHVGDKVLIQSFGNAVRQVTLRGIFSPAERTAATDLISYMDAQTLRDLLGMAAAADRATSLDPSETALLSSPEDSLFQGAGQVVQGAEAARRAPPAPVQAAPQPVAPDGGPWQFLLVSLRDPGAATAFITRTNAWLSAQGIEARAEDWRGAVGPFAVFPALIGMVFMLAVVVVSVVAVIIIMNTLVVSIGERASEIGTMRALGAQKRFVWRMLLLETLAICVVFGVIGMLLGSALVGLMNGAGLRGSGMLMQVAAGSTVLRPAVALSSLGTSILLVILVALAAHIYPVRTALRIQPVAAIQGQSE